MINKIINFIKEQTSINKVFFAEAQFSQPKNESFIVITFLPIKYPTERKNQQEVVDQELETITFKDDVDLTLSFDLINKDFEQAFNDVTSLYEAFTLLNKRIFLWKENIGILKISEIGKRTLFEGEYYLGNFSFTVTFNYKKSLTVSNENIIRLSDEPIDRSIINIEEKT